MNKNYNMKDLINNLYYYNSQMIKKIKILNKYKKTKNKVNNLHNYNLQIF